MILETYHFHVCENCRRDWLHERRKGLTPEESAAYHRRPKCGAGPYKFAYETKRDAMAIVRILMTDDPLYPETQKPPPS